MTDERLELYLLEDTLSTVEAQLAEVNRRLIRAALNKGMSREGRKYCQQNLRDCADRLERMPLAKRSG